MNIRYFVICYFFTSFICLGQTSKNYVKNNSSEQITKVEFDNIVEKIILLLQSKQLSEISDNDHILIMKCHNTIFRNKLVSKKYDNFKSLIIDKQYQKEITKIYPEWTPNKGMGFYFPKLKMEYGGTPSPNALYEIIK